MNDFEEIANLIWKVADLLRDQLHQIFLRIKTPSLS